MNASEKPSSHSTRWPTGTSFLLYCAGISLIFLVGYVIFSGKGFDFSATEKGIAFRSALNQAGTAVTNEKQQEKSAQFQEKFENIKRVAAETPIHEAPVDVDPPKPKRNTSITSPDPDTRTNPANLRHGFNGRWTGNGSIYVLEQQGSIVALMEMTNGIVTSYAQGTASGDQANLIAGNVSGMTFPVQIQSEGRRLKLIAMGNEFYLDPE